MLICSASLSLSSALSGPSVINMVMGCIKSLVRTHGKMGVEIFFLRDRHELIMKQP